MESDFPPASRVDKKPITVTIAEIEAANELMRQLLKNKGQLSGCVSFLQRKMTITYTRTAVLMAEMESKNFINAH